MTRRPHLHTLAHLYGILPSYIDQQGRTQVTADASRVALLAAMGVDAATEGAARRAVEEETRAQRNELLPPVCVTAEPRDIAINRAAIRGGGPIEWAIELRGEDGTVVGQGAGRGARVSLPAGLAPGYYRLQMSATRRGAPSVDAERSLIVTPNRCVLPRDVVGQRRVFGFLVNLYSVRSGRNWGVGDTGDLRALVRWGAAVGAAFVGLNPLHVLANRGPCISPYDPVSRLFRNPLYLDVSAIPELADTPAVARRLASRAMQRGLRTLRASTRVEYERIMALKLPLLQQLYRTFVRTHRVADSARGRAFRQFCRSEGEALLDFATFQVLHTRLGTGDACVAPTWHHWPIPFRDRHPAAIEHIRNDDRDEIDFHRYLQFELEVQLEHVAREARAHHVPIGVYQDLAIGSARDGSDAWAFRELFVDGVSVGAPPDDYNAAGQNWNFPPFNPRRLRATAYDYFVRVIRANLRAAGALRIDHVMGLLRQYWIPNGTPAAGGAYVRFPADDLFGIVALESHRARALVVGEDLGTVPAEIPGLLRRWGVLSTRVFYFERDQRGRFRPAGDYPARALVSANTHDLPPVKGFLEGRDLAMRHQLGLLDGRALAHARRERAKDTTALSQRLQRARLLRKQRAPATASEVRDAIHVFLGRTRAVLLGIALDDLAGERDPVNVPGVDVDRHPSWSRRMERTFAAIAADAGVRRSLRQLGQRRWRVRRR